MKLFFSLAILFALGCPGLHAQTASANANTTATGQATLPAPTAYQVVNRGGSYKVWQRQVYEKLPNGTVVSHVNSYTELASGLNYQDANGNWQDASEEIKVQPDGTAAATEGQHQAYFPADIYQGTIRVVTPDGLPLQSQPAALAYDDGNNMVIIGVLTNSVGQLLGTNQAIYVNAFSGVNADILYTYKKGGFEQDIVLRHSLPAPESLGLNPDTTRLQVMTEFFNPPTPAEQSSGGDAETGLTDTTLKFGSVTFGHGRAFLMNETSQSLRRPAGQIPVFKSWLETQGRTFLIESVPYHRIQGQLQVLPTSASITKPKTSGLYARRGTAGHYHLPAAHLLTARAGKARFTRATSIDNDGLVLDYITINSGETNFTFQGDNTYYVSGQYNLLGITTLEGGTVIKLNGYGEIGIDASGSIVCATGPYRPAIFTSYNDNSVGQSFGSGTPALGDVGQFLYIAPTNCTIHDLRFSYCWGGIEQDLGYLDVWDSQFENIGQAVFGYDVGLHNVLINRSFNSYPAIWIENLKLDAENVTADGGNSFVDVDGYSTAKIAMTNCLITSQPLLSTDGFLVTPLTNDTVWIPSPTTPIYQVVGGGSYYLTNGSPYRDYGTTNVDPSLLAELPQTTTYPPLVYGAGTVFGTNLTLAPQAARDTNTFPDLGYHYPPLDYAIGGVTVSNNVTLSLAAGTVMGWYYGSSGVNAVTLKNGANLTSSGTATQPCWITHTCLAQEGNGNWQDSGGVGVEFNGTTATNQPQLNLRFTKWSGMNFIANDLNDGGAYGIGNYTDCEFYDGAITVYHSTQLYTNCLFYRMSSTYWAAATYTYQNCTFYNGAFISTRLSGQQSSLWTFRNTAFDGLGFQINDNFSGNTNYTAYDFNAYNTNNLGWQTYPYYSPLSNTLETVGVHDLFVTNYNWESSWFGEFYLPPNSPLIDHGSTTADQLGLYHFTTQTNQIVESNSVVDIGYHYVATDSNGNPLDSNGDGIPDYLEDANGDGIYDTGDLGDWQSYLHLNVLICRPSTGSPLP